MYKILEEKETKTLNQIEIDNIIDNSINLSILLDLKEVLKSCIYKYYIANKNLDISSKKVFKTDEKNSIIKSTNKVKVLSLKGVKGV